MFEGRSRRVSVLFEIKEGLSLNDARNKGTPNKQVDDAGKMAEGKGQARLHAVQENPHSTFLQ